QEAHRCAEDAREGGEDRDGGLQRLHVVWSDFQQRVSLLHGFMDQAEFAVFEVADATMDHVGAGTRSALAVVASLDKRHINPLHGKVTEGCNSVDATANNQNLRLRTFTQFG